MYAVLCSSTVMSSDKDKKRRQNVLDGSQPMERRWTESDHRLLNCCITTKIADVQEHFRALTMPLPGPRNMPKSVVYFSQWQMSMPRTVIDCLHFFSRRSVGLRKFCAPLSSMLPILVLRQHEELNFIPGSVYHVRRDIVIFM
jgi:hypothetical protein